MAEKKFALNLSDEAKDTLKDSVDLAKQCYNLVIQIVSLVSALIPMARQLTKKLKSFKAAFKQK